jgi:hypothetical protein
MHFVVETYDLMGDRFPKASVSTDEHGSIRLTWSKLEPDCEVRLICPAHVDQTAYLYHELGSSYAVERDVTVSKSNAVVRMAQPNMREFELLPGDAIV